MPLTIPAGAARAPDEDDAGTYLSGFDDLARQTTGYANERTHPAIASDKLASSARQFTAAIDSLGKQLDELKKAGVGASGRDSFMEAVRALQGELAQGRTSAPKTADAYKAIGSMHDRVTKGWDRMSDGQRQLVDRISRQLARMEDIASRSAPSSGRPSRAGMIAKAVADKHGVGDYLNAAFAKKSDRKGDDYQSSFARLARTAAGRNGLGGVFDAAFKAHPGAAPVRRVGDAVAARAAADRAFIGPRMPGVAPASASVPTVPSAPSGHAQGQPGAGNVLSFIKPASRNTNVGSSTQAIPVISIGKDESRIASSMDGLNKNVIRLNDTLDRDHRQRLGDYERRRQDQFDHDQALYGRKDSAISHGPGGALASAAAAHGKGAGDHGGGWLSDLVHSVVEGGLGAEAGAAGVGGLLLGGRKLLGRTKGAVKGVAKGVGGLGRFMKGRHGKFGLMAGLLTGTAYGAYRLFGADSAQAAENPQGAPGPEDESRGGRRRGRTEDGPEPEAGEKPEMGFNAGETARGAAYHGLEKSTDAVAEHFASRREAIEHARQHAALDHAEHAPGKAAADFAAKERALLGESPAAHAAKVAVPSPVAPVSTPTVEAGSTAAKVEAPIAKVAGSAPGASFGKEVERAASDVVKARTGARAVTTAARALGKGLLKVLGPLGLVLELYDGWQQLQDLYGARKAGEISEAEFNTEFYAILARMAAGPAGAAIGAELGAMGGGAAGAVFAGVGAGPGAVIGGIGGGIAGYFSGPKLADKAVHAIMDKARPEIDAEVDAKLKGKTTPSEPAKKEEGPKSGEDGQPHNAMGGPGGASPAGGEGGAVTQPSPAGNGATASAGGGGAAWDGATSHTIGGVGHQGEVHDARNAFRGTGGRRAGRGVSAAEGIGTADTGGTASSGGPITPSDQTGPGGGSDIDWSAAILRKKEGFTGRAAWDVNHHRLGYGSDTITDAQGNVREVRPGDRVTREDAERDLRRRMPQFQAKLRGQVGAEAWDRLDPATKGALTSVGYNYGSFGKLKSLTAAVRSGDKAQIANAVRGLQGHNGGVNRQRRLEEASIIESGHLPGSWRMQDPGSTGPGQPSTPATPGTDKPQPATTPSSPAGPGDTPISGGSPPAGGSGNAQPGAPGPNVPMARSGETTEQLAHRIQNQNPRMRGPECVALARQTAGIKEGVRDWRAGGKVSDGTMPIGTPIATFMDRHGNQSDRYDGGIGVGIHAKDVIAQSHGRLGAGTTHAAVLAGYERDRNGRVTGIKVQQQWVGKGQHQATIKVGDRRGGEADADNYRSVVGRDGQPLGDMNPMNPNAKNYAGGPVAARSAAAQPEAVPAPQGAPAAPGAPRGTDAPQVPDASKTVRSASPTDRVSTGWDPGMRSAYDAPSTPQVPGAKADPGMRSAYDPAPPPPADPGLRSAYDAPPPATKVDQPTDVPVQAAKTSAAINASASPSSGGDSSGGSSSSGGGDSSGGGGGSSGGGFCRCTGGGSGGGGGKMDGFGESPMSPLLAIMNSTLFNRG